MEHVRSLGGDRHHRGGLGRTVVSTLAEQRRGHELRLVIFAGIITAAAYTLASLGQNSEIPPRILPFLGFLLLILMSAHIAVRLLAPGADGTLLPLAVMLNGLGYVMIARLSERLAGLQTTWTFIGVAAFAATLLVVQRVNDLARFKWTFFVVGAGLLMLPMVPSLGFSSGGARIWVSIGPINFQPGEFAKLALALFFAAYLAETRELIKQNTWKVGPFQLPEPR
ncbi:MAG: FtsW/RodA/SpoVE family cell cycle protein, partial [Actinobacteria bacterium]|nr:FtsW/RodA/SpoVE family cell cycle protein [Actinomycetota bacterium]